MSREINLGYITGRNLKAIVKTATGQYVLGTTPEAWDAAHVASYGIAVPELSTGAGQYAGNFPGVAAGLYSVEVYDIAGSTLATSDAPPIGGGEVQWDGTRQVVMAPVQSDGDGGYQYTEDALALAPSASDGDGSGAIAVTEDTGGTNNLAAIDPSGHGIQGVTVRAYLAAEWAASPVTAPIRGQQVTISTGEWGGPMYLDAGTYVFTFTISGYSAGLKTQAVA